MPYSSHQYPYVVLMFSSLVWLCTGLLTDEVVCLWMLFC
jgi:hypothetical protein